MHLSATVYMKNWWILKQHQDPKLSFRKTLTADVSVPHDRSNWHSFKVTLPSAGVMCLTNFHSSFFPIRLLSCHCQGVGAKKRLTLSCLFLYSQASLYNSFSGLLHISILSLPVFLALSSSITNTFSHPNTICLLLAESPLSPHLLLLDIFSPAPIWGKIVTVWFQEHQMFSSHHGYIGLGFVCFSFCV